jgi:maleate isomerase
MTHRPEYATAGTVGLIIPRESTTVEPELSVLLGPDVAVLAMRMADVAGTPFERMRANGRDIPHHVQSFGMTPIDVFGYCLTASSYLGHDRDVVVEVDHAGGKTPVVSAAGSNRAALAALGARRIALVSPYWTELTDTAVAYWVAHGIDVGPVIPIGPAKEGHSIYGLRGAEILEGVRRASMTAVDAILVTGTGAPSLGALAAAQRPDAIPVISSNFCMGWQLATSLDGTAGGLADWMDPGARWKSELRRRYPAATI